MPNIISNTAQQLEDQFYESEDNVVAVGSKPLRLMEQSYWHGVISYVAKRRDDLGVTLELRVKLPPDDDEIFVLDFLQSATRDVETVREFIRQTVIQDYVFKNLNLKDGTQRKGLTAVDVHRFEEIADEVVRNLDTPSI